MAADYTQTIYLDEYPVFEYTPPEYSTSSQWTYVPSGLPMYDVNFSLGENSIKLSPLGGRGGSGGGGGGSERPSSGFLYPRGDC